MKRNLDIPEAEAAFDVLNDLMSATLEEVNDPDKVKARVVECLEQIEIGLRALDAGSEHDYAVALVIEARETFGEKAARELAEKLKVEYDTIPPPSPRSNPPCG